MTDTAKKAAMTHIDVLCVDDDEIVLRSLTRLLKTNKLTAIACSNPETALTHLKSHEFGLIISDMRMPKMNGAQFLEQARKLAPDTQRILLTGYADIETTLAAVNQGQISGYIQKPWQNDLLLGSINNSLEKFQLKKQNQILEEQVKTQNLKLIELNNDLEQRVEKRTKQIKQVLKQLEEASEREKIEHKSTVELLYNFINANPYLDGNRAQNIANTCTQIALYLNLSQKSIDLAPMAGYLAQIGLLAMDPDLYKKPVNKLSESQRKTFYTHPSTAQLMLMPATHLHDVSDAIYHQFERYNGNGMPKGLAGNDIPIGAMVLGLARDYWDAFEQSNAANEQDRHVHALDTVKLYSGTFYHPKIVRALEASQTKMREQKSSAGSILICNASELKENMILGHALHSHTGIMLLPKGHIFSRKSIEKLQQLEAKKPTPFRIMVKTAK
ncbi:HD domain-containing phosphohydrolase [Pseudoalteromonas fuliginea]|uniref:Response regulator n=1 Tax=Pseudoalteromonas fuliginea TaxID=1872678 RepID=A0ABQ6RDQ3_9GAMM|nr:HD domain-containing phosphohydrolase [Pseudoalteromonas fuliginea]KAA1150876.1 response regulator [Pseudoalteromonas fuliginea]KAA1165549.1 response regulator [Pseudoalteromonas fuliginea]